MKIDPSLVQRLANILAFERRCIHSSGVVPHMPIMEHGIGGRGYPRERISSGSGALVRRILPVRLHLRALLAWGIDALDAQAICETLHYAFLDSL